MKSFTIIWFGQFVSLVGTAVMGTAVSVAGYLFRPIRNIEEELADHDLESGLSPDSLPRH